MQLKKLFQAQDDSSHSEYFVMNNLELTNFLCSLINIDSDIENAEAMNIVFKKHLLPLTNILIKNHELTIRYDLLNILTVHFYAQIDRIIETAISSEERTRAGNSWILHFKKLYSELREETKSIDDSNLSELFLDCSAYKIPKYIPVSFSFSAEELVSIMEAITNDDKIFDFFNKHPKNLITIFLLTNPKSDNPIQLLEKYQSVIELEEEGKHRLEEERKHRLEEERKHRLEEERKRKLEEERKRKLEIAQHKLENAEHKLKLAKQRKREEERKRKLEEERKRKRKLEEERKRELEEERKRKLEEERKRKLEEERKRKLEEERKPELERKKTLLLSLENEIMSFCDNPIYRGFILTKKAGQASLAASRSQIIIEINNYKTAFNDYQAAIIRRNLIGNITELSKILKMTRAKKAIMKNINNLLEQLQEYES